MIDFFTPFHISLLRIIADIIILIIQDGVNFVKEIHISIIYMLFIIFLILMILVFIEIIQLNFCGLSTMTKKNIEERARLDSMENDDIDIDDEEIIKEDDNKDKDKDKEGNRFTIKGYSVELKNLNIIKFYLILF